MNLLIKIKNLILGEALDPLKKSAHGKLLLTAFIAWIGLGADGLSSSCYGPEQSFLALGSHSGALAIFLTLATGLTVFLIAFGYNQVIELFPQGGGGYKVSTALLGKYPGLVTGAALIMDYTLTIVISIVSAVDAFFSFLPASWQEHKITIDSIIIIMLLLLNLRGVKESIKILLPIFIGFLLTHIALISYGIFTQRQHLIEVVTTSGQHTHTLAASMGIFFVISLFMHAYSMGGGTYTGLEAVSNNVNILVEPRVKTGKITMLFMAVSLSLTAAGIMLLYLLWHVTPNYNQTLNAIAFQNILGNMPFSHSILIMVLCFEAGLLIVSANTGFLGGPAVLANMAIDEWVPHRYRLLSSRLVKQNGILLYGIAAIIILHITQGRIKYLVVFYSINVFLAFTLSLFGLSKHWFDVRHSHWKRRFALSGIGAIVCGTILIMIAINQFFHGGLISIVFVVLIVLSCLSVKKHYVRVNTQLMQSDKTLTAVIQEGPGKPTAFDPAAPTAIYFIGNHPGVGIHTVLWSLKMFPHYFKNMVFVSIGEIDVESYGAEKKVEAIRETIHHNLNYFTRFANQHGYGVKTLIDYSTATDEKIAEISLNLRQEYPNCLFFASSFVWGKDSWWMQYLHNETAFAIQRRLHMENLQMIVIPMKIE